MSFSVRNTNRARTTDENTFIRPRAGNSPCDRITFFFRTLICSVYDFPFLSNRISEEELVRELELTSRKKFDELPTAPVAETPSPTGPEKHSIVKKKAPASSPTLRRRNRSKTLEDINTPSSPLLVVVPSSRVRVQSEGLVSSSNKENEEPDSGWKVVTPKRKTFSKGESTAWIDRDLKLSYHYRVSRWLDTVPGSRLDPVFFRDYKNQTDWSQEKARLKHSFTTLIDQVSGLEDFAFSTTSKCDSIARCTFVAYCKNKLSGPQYVGYATSRSGLCFHRCISTETRNPEILRCQKKVEEAVRKKHNTLPILLERVSFSNGDTLSTDEARTVIQIHDGVNDFDICLFSKKFLGLGPRVRSIRL